MCYTKNVFLLVVFVFNTENIRCGPLVGQLPADIIANILSILISGAVQLIGNCTGADNGAPATNYWVYTNDNPDTPIIVTEPTANICGKSSNIIFITHGWFWNASVPYLQGVKDAYLKRYTNACIIATNWGAYAQQNYQSAYCAARGVALNNARFICQLRSVTGLPLNKLHLVGHSMGAHIYGMAGFLVQSICNEKLGRITGLDPAGPLFQAIATKHRLDPSDAFFVDIIHTNQGKYGYIGSCGHLDVYPNCGYVQPGCLQQVLAEGDILNLPSNYISCNHRRSVLVFQESILSDNFKAVPCFGCGIPLLVCVGLNTETKVIGENAMSPGSTRNYYLKINSKPPFARG